MKKFSTLTSTIVPLAAENIDTDQIIPARFLKTTTKSGFGDNLFHDWRYDEKGAPVEAFALNKYKGEILVTGRNFGCGSSREHAAWAVAGYGFRAVVSSSFADIFKANALNNGVLPVTVTEAFLATILSDERTILTLNLQAQTVMNENTGETERFPIDPFKKNCLLEGLDDINYLLANRDKIEKYEKNH